MGGGHSLSVHDKETSWRKAVMGKTRTLTRKETIPWYACVPLGQGDLFHNQVMWIIRRRLSGSINKQDNQYVINVLQFDSETWDKEAKHHQTNSYLGAYFNFGSKPSLH